MQISFHEQLLALGKQLGYLVHDAGSCHGFAVKWLEACLIGEEEAFHLFTKDILEASVDSNIVEKIEAVKLKVKSKLSLTIEEQTLLNILVFYETLVLYQGPSDQTKLFDQFYIQRDFPQVSRVAGSEKIQKQGGLTSVYSEIGYYNPQELLALLREYENLFNRLGESEENLGILIGSGFHSIGLIYEKSSCSWIFKDINTHLLHESNDKKKYTTEEIINEIYASLSRTSSGLAMETHIITTKDYAERHGLKEQFQKFKMPQIITEEIAQREHIEQLAILAAENNNMALIDQLIDYHVLIDQPNDKGVTALMMAAQNGHALLVEKLLAYGANPNVQIDGGGVTPLYLAARNGHIGIVEQLLNHGADPNLTGDRGFTALIAAAQQGFEDLVVKLLEKHGDPNHVYSKGFTAVFSAISSNHKNILVKLLESGANPDHKSDSKVTPLINAVSLHHFDCVPILLKYGADPNQMFYPSVPDVPQNPSHSIVDFFKHYIQLISKKSRYMPILSLAVREGSKEAVTELLKCGANPNKTDHEGLTSLFEAVSDGRQDIVAELIQYGGNPCLADKQGFSVICWAIYKGNENILNELLKYETQDPTDIENIHKAIFYANWKGLDKMAQILQQYLVEMSMNSVKPR